MDDKNLLWARWTTFSALILVFWFYLFTAAPWNFLVSGIFAIITAALLTAVLEFWLRLSINLNRSSASQHGFQTQNQLKSAHTRSMFSLLILDKFLHAHSESEILDAVMQVGVSFLAMNGASFVPYDEWGKSLPALVYGKVPGSALQTWMQRLSLPETRQVCKNCQVYHGESNCILLLADTALHSHVHCFPLISGGREIGVLNFYCDREIPPDAESQAYFAEILNSAGLALENLHKRDQEIAALLYLQTITSPKSDLSILLNSFLENIIQVLDVDFALLYLPDGVPGQINPKPKLFSLGKNDVNSGKPGPDLPFLAGIWKSVLKSGQSLSLENVLFNNREMWKILFAVPLVWRGNEPTGVLVLGSNSTQVLAQHRRTLLETLAGQAALLVQNEQLLVRVEYQAVVDERTRLAREIHDGLAQTLAFLKIQSVQMQNYLSRGEIEKLDVTLKANYRTLSDAYIDARQAIDNLRRMPSPNLADWIKQVAGDFEQATLQKVDVKVEEFSNEYPANIQAQLIRIVQEALSNIRKHANAQNVIITGHQDDDSLFIKIHDDGCGFNSDGVNHNSQYGLRGMRERAESIGADFQITSQPGKGTIVSLRMPLGVEENMSRIRLVVVDDHALFRRGLVSLLDEMMEFFIVGEASNGQDALGVIEDVKPDIVLLDINMPVLDGIQTLAAIRKLNPDQKVLMLTISQNDEDLIGAIVSGANGYVLKNTEPESLRSTLLQVFAGNSVLSPEITAKVLQAVRRSQADRNKGLLSDREVEVLKCLARGQTTAQIANVLFISENTVKTHIRHILEKMEVNNRAEAVARAAQMGLI